MLLKIESPNDGCKKLIKANNISEILHLSMSKFNLPNLNYKLVLSHDGAEIEDDEILLSYVEEYGTAPNQPITLLILAKNVTYSQYISRKNYDLESLPESLPETSSLGSYDAHNKQDEEPDGIPIVDLSDDSNDETERRTINAQDLEMKFWSKLPVRAIKDCAEQKPINLKDMNQIINILINYVLKDLRDPSRESCEQLAQLIFNKHPKSFVNIFSKRIGGNGYEPLFREIFTSVQNRNRTILNIMNKKRKLIENEKTVSRRRKEYGCVDYAGELNDGETYKMLEEKRSRLENMHYSQNRNAIEILNLMDQTYPLQRSMFNAKRQISPGIMAKWPFLQESQYFLQHANRLLGTTVQTIWVQNIQEHAENLIELILSFQCNENLLTERNKIVNECITWSKSTGNIMLRQLLIFPLLLWHFSENQENLYKVLKIDMTEADVLKAEFVNNPTLLIKGASLYDIQAKSILVLPNNIKIACQNLMNGFLMTFLSYFVFGYNYSAEVEKTLEFIQRMIMGMNPNEGNKTARRSQNQSFDKDVAHLIRLYFAYIRTKPRT